MAQVLSESARTTCLTPYFSKTTEEANESLFTRREMIAGPSAALATVALAKVTGTQAAAPIPNAVPLSLANVSFRVKGHSHILELDTRTTLLDALREHLHHRCGLGLFVHF